MGRRIARVGLLTGLSLIMFLVEGLFPPMVVPGARLGLGNIFIMMILLCFSYGEALLAVAVKSLLSAIFIGNLSAALYSLPAGVAAISVSYLLGEENEKTASPTTDGLSEYDIKALAWFHSLSPEKRKAILSLADGPEELAELPDCE